MRNWTKSTRTCLPADLLICHEFRARLEDVRMITVDGDSTEPLLLSGCHILINVSTQSPVPTERRLTQILRSAVRASAPTMAVHDRSVVRPRASATWGDHRIRGENGLGSLPVGQMDATFRCPVRYIRSLEYRSGGKARALPPVSSENYETAYRHSWIA